MAIRYGEEHARLTGGRGVHKTVARVAIVVVLLHCATVHASDEVFPIAQAPAEHSAAAALGERLFHDKGLSRAGEFACATCHDLTRGGSDGRKTSLAPDGGDGDLNTPSIFNVAQRPYLNWDGQFRTLEAHAEDAVTNPLYFGSSWERLLAYLAASASYLSVFEEVFDATPNRSNTLSALVAFERTLVTPNAPFDRWLQGEQDAIRPGARSGYQLFVAYGCIACHQGRGIGGNVFAHFGAFKSPWGGARKPRRRDYGRFNVTNDERDRFVFNVPSLRNVAVTAPYFHDGSAPTLEEAVQRMAALQLGLELPSDEADDIVAFLETLTGEYRGKALTP